MACNLTNEQQQAANTQHAARQNLESTPYERRFGAVFASIGNEAKAGVPACHLAEDVKQLPAVDKDAALYSLAGEGYQYLIQGDLKNARRMLDTFWNTKAGENASFLFRALEFSWFAHSSVNQPQLAQEKARYAANAAEAAQQRNPLAPLEHLASYQAASLDSRDALLESLSTYRKQKGRPYRDHLKFTPDAAKPTEQTVVAGNPAVGRVKFFAQFHNIQAQPEMSMSVAAYQGALLKALQDAKPKHVFAEGQIVTVEPNHPERKDALLMAEVKKAFPRGVPADVRSFNEAQLTLLAAEGAPVVYAALNPDVTLHRTTTAVEQFGFVNELVTNMLQIQDDYRAAFLANPRDMTNARLMHAVAPVLNPLITEYREQRTAEIVESFLKAHPGAEVALVYGGTHRFEETPWKNAGGPVPEVKSYRFPKLIEQDPNMRKFTEIAEQDPKRQIEVVRAAKSFEANGLPLLRTPEARLAVLDKLQITPNFPADPQLLRSALLGLAYPPEQHQSKDALAFAARVDELQTAGKLGVR